MRIFFGVFVGIFFLDQIIKILVTQTCDFAEGCKILDLKVISLMLVFNKGVAFSFFSFLGDGLKYVQICMLMVVIFLLYKQKVFFLQNQLAFGLIFAGGCSNILDRFTYGGVVDYVYWHYLFEFAIFNFADVMIDVGVAFLLWAFYKDHKSQRAISSAKK